MLNNNHTSTEKKLQRLEELLVPWHQEFKVREENHHKLYKATINILCIFIGAIGVIWSAVEVTDWCLTRKKSC